MKASGSLGLELDQIEQRATKARPSLQVIPKPEEVRGLEISRMFAELEGHDDRDLTWFVFTERSAPWADCSYYELDERLAYLATQTRGKRLLSDFTWAAWRTMLDCFDWACAYCGSKNNVGQDHLRSLRTGGSDKMGNIVPACEECRKNRYGAMCPPISTWLRSRGKKFKETAEARIRRGTLLMKRK